MPRKEAHEKCRKSLSWMAKPNIKAYKSRTGSVKNNVTSWKVYQANHLQGWQSNEVYMLQCCTCLTSLDGKWGTTQQHADLFALPSTQANRPLHFPRGNVRPFTLYCPNWPRDEFIMARRGNKRHEQCTVLLGGCHFQQQILRDDATHSRVIMDKVL